MILSQDLLLTQIFHHLNYFLVVQKPILVKVSIVLELEEVNGQHPQYQDKEGQLLPHQEGGHPLHPLQENNVGTFINLVALKTEQDVSSTERSITYLNWMNIFKLPRVVESNSAKDNIDSIGIYIYKYYMWKFSFL